MPPFLTRTLSIGAIAAGVLATAVSALPATAEVRIDHRYGTTVIPKAPERVVSLDFTGTDDLLALGVAPVAVRDWYGDYPHGVWPWAQDALGGAEPVLLAGGIDVERIAALRPDLILGLASGMTAEDYALLSRIAPTVAPGEGQTDFGTPWDRAALIRGRATGHSDDARARVDALDARLDAIAAAHPEWQGMTAAVAFAWNGTPGAYRSVDTRVRLLSRLGFEVPPAIEAAGGPEAFYVPLSGEDLSALDADLLVWIAEGDDAASIASLTLRPTLDAHVEGREVFAGKLLGGAMSMSSLLSLPFALDRLVPLIEVAVDGDPATPVETTAAAGLAP